MPDNTLKYNIKLDFESCSIADFRVYAFEAVSVLMVKEHLKIINRAVNVCLQIVLIYAQLSLTIQQIKIIVNTIGKNAKEKGSLTRTYYWTSPSRIGHYGL